MNQHVSADWLDMSSCDPNATVIHDPVFIEIIEEVYGCNSLASIVKSDMGQTGVPMYQVGPTLFGRKITSHPFSFYPGLLGAGDETAAFLHLVERARSLGRKWYVEYKSFSEIPEANWHDIGNVQRVALLVDSSLHLKSDLEAQMSSYSKSLRQNLRTTRRRADENRIVLRRADNERDVKGLYDVLTRLNRDKHSMISHPYSLFRLLYHKLGALGKASFYVAEKDGDIVAGTVLLCNDHHWEYCWGAADAKVAKFGVNTLLVDMMINDAVVAGARIMGFGSSSPNDETLLKFKSRWGCVSRPVNHYFWNATPQKIDLNDGMPMLRSLVQHVPLKLIQTAAPLVVPFLA
jgi:serine/alanine adding enzyme